MYLGGDNPSFGAFNLKNKINGKTIHSLKSVIIHQSLLFHRLLIKFIQLIPISNHLKYQINDQNIVKVNSSKLINIENPKIVIYSIKETINDFWIFL